MYIFNICCNGEDGMRKSITLIALALVSLLAFNGTALMTFASKPTVVINPLQGNVGESFNFDVTATSWCTVSEIEVEDPNGDTWVLESKRYYGWTEVSLELDAGDSIRITWPEADISELGGHVSIPTELRWKNQGGTDSSHTNEIGTYSVSFSGIGCFYFYCDSFLVVPEGPLGTVSFLLICVASLVMYKRVSPKVRL